MATEIRLIDGTFQNQNELRNAKVECRVINDRYNNFLTLHYGDIYIGVGLRDVERIIEKARRR